MRKLRPVSWTESWRFPRGRTNPEVQGHGPQEWQGHLGPMLVSGAQVCLVWPEERFSLSESRTTLRQSVGSSAMLWKEQTYAPGLWGGPCLDSTQVVTDLMSRNMQRSFR